MSNKSLKPHLASNCFGKGEEWAGNLFFGDGTSGGLLNSGQFVACSCLRVRLAWVCWWTHRRVRQSGHLISCWPRWPPRLLQQAPAQLEHLNFSLARPHLVQQRLANHAALGHQPLQSLLLLVSRLNFGTVPNCLTLLRYRNFLARLPASNSTPRSES